MYKSVAEAYQDIRREWKRKRNNAQRKQTMLWWETINKSAHPMVAKIIAKARRTDPSKIRVALSTNAFNAMLEARNDVSEYQQLLNRYKVKENASKAS